MNYATIGLVSGAVQLLWVAVAIAVAVLLILAYVEQKIGGYLWLLAATVVWPLVTRLSMFGLTMTMPRMAMQHAYPMATIALIQIVVGGVFQLVDVVLLAIAVQQLASGMRRRLIVAPPAQPGFAPYVPPSPPPPPGSQWPSV